MPEVKLVWTKDISGIYDESAYYCEIARGINDWEELSDEDLTFLRTHLYDLKPPYPGYRPSLIVKPQQELGPVILSLKKQLQVAQERAQAKEKARKLKKKKLQAATLAKKRQLFEQLKAEFGQPHTEEEV